MFILLHLCVTCALWARRRWDVTPLTHALNFSSLLQSGARGYSILHQSCGQELIWMDVLNSPLTPPFPQWLKPALWECEKTSVLFVQEQDGENCSPSSSLYTPGSFSIDTATAESQGHVGLWGGDVGVCVCGGGVDRKREWKELLTFFALTFVWVLTHYIDCVFGWNIKILRALPKQLFNLCCTVGLCRVSYCRSMHCMRISVEA